MLKLQIIAQEFKKLPKTLKISQIWSHCYKKTVRMVCVFVCACFIGVPEGGR